jgi:hypothetical protein
VRLGRHPAALETQHQVKPESVAGAMLAKQLLVVAEEPMDRQAGEAPSVSQQGGLAALTY